MSDKVVPNLRVVRCPKCQQLLPEPPGCDLYKCGGCGTLLKAKGSAVTSESSIQETDAASRNALDTVSEGKQYTDRKHRVSPREDRLKAKATTSSSGERSMDGSIGRGQNENGEDSSNQLVPVNVSDEELESELDICKLSLRRHRVSNKASSSKITPSEIEEINNANLLLEGSNEKLIYGPDEDGKDKSALVGENVEVESTGSNKPGEKLNDGKLLQEGAEQKLDMNAQDGEGPKKNQSTMRSAKSKVYTAESASSTKKSSTEKRSTLLTSGKLEEGSSGKPASPSNKQQKQTENKIHRSFYRARPMDTLDTSELIDTNSKLSKSPTARSSSAYDGMGEQLPTPHLDSLRSSYTVAEGRSRNGKSLVNSLLHGAFGTQHQSDMPHEKHHHVMKDSRRAQKVLDDKRHDNQHLMRTKREEFPIPSRMPFHQSGYESGTPSNRMRDELHSNSSFASPNSHEDTEQEKVKLLRMIHKLEDQLRRSRSVSEETNGRFPSTATGISYKGNHVSAYHDPHKGRFPPQILDHHRYDGRYNHEVTSRQRHNFPRMPYSVEATRNSPHVNHYGYQFHPHFSAEFPPHALFQHEQLHRSYPGQDYFSYQSFYPSRPQRYAASESDVQRHRYPEVRKHSREQKNLAKRHHKPVAGGAPFVTCHKCLSLLHLPVDFLLPKRASHELKCGKCSEILKFSLQKGRMVSLSSNPIGPSSSDKSNVISGNYHANYYHYSPAEPISFFDDYGLPVSKSHSSEGDTGYLSQIHPLHGSKYDNLSVSGGTFEPVTEKEKTASRYSSTISAPVEKLSTEMEAGPTPKSSSLHKLMGYFSPSQVIRGSRPPVEGKGANSQLRK